MRTKSLVGLGCYSVLLMCSLNAEAALTLGSGLGTTHAGNLVTNGSFETGAPAAGTANQIYWATGTTLTPFGVPTGWTSSGASSSYATWGNDATFPQSLRGGDTIPDGNSAMYFGNGAPVFSSQPPTFLPSGRVTFPSPPTINNFAAPFPVILSQSLNTPATPAPSYKFSFWVSGENAATAQAFAGPGIFGLQVTNVLVGDPIQYLAVPNGINNSFGLSHLYEFTFVPLDASQPVTINFINWGHFDLSPHGGVNFTTELILDDVIVNAVPEPTVLACAAWSCVIFLGRRSTASGRRKESCQLSNTTRF